MYRVTDQRPEGRLKKGGEMLIRRVMTCAFAVAAAVLLAAPVAAQTSDGAPPTFCSTEPNYYLYKAGRVSAEDNGFSSWDVEVIDGPCPVACPSIEEGKSVKGVNLSENGYSLPCNVIEEGDALCTGILYGVTATGQYETDLVGILARPPIAYGFGEDYVFDRCEGDPFDLGLGINNCHEQVITYEVPSPGPVEKNGPSYDFVFAVVGEGNRDVSSTTVAVGEDIEGYYVEYCEIQGLGRQIPESCVPACGHFNANQTITKKEILDFKGCKLEFVFDLDTGGVIDVNLLGPQGPQNPNDCEFSEFPVGQLKLNIPTGTNGSVGLDATFGEALVSAGTDSCSCRVIGGRVYCWGRNCPQ